MDSGVGPTGKIRYGETILEGAARELLEETSLTATLEYKGVHHKMDYAQESGKLLEDKIFFCIYGFNPQGILADEFEGGRNAWLTFDEIKKLEDAFEGLQGELKVDDPIRFEERRYEYGMKQY